MKVHFQIFWLILLVNIRVTIISAQCGCKSLRPCYRNMLDALQGKDEEACIEDSSIGASTMMVYFKALTQFCGEFIHVTSSRITYEGRLLYETLFDPKLKRKDREELPVIVVDAGQGAGLEPVEMALYLIEQLVACGELEEMITKAKWIIMPCTNPDGLEYSRFARPLWRKNTRILDDGVSYGVDITRNFEVHWDVCKSENNGFSTIYPGPAAASENETKFITEVLTRHKRETKAYLSIRRDGHAIMYPHAFKDQESKPSMEVAANIAAKVNQRGNIVQAFVDDSIYNVNGRAHCGHSVDYAIEQGIMLAFEMRVFHSNDLEILSNFQTLPKGYRATLRNSYFTGIKELYNNVTTEKRKNRAKKTY